MKKAVFLLLLACSDAFAESCDPQQIQALIEERDRLFTENFLLKHPDVKYRSHEYEEIKRLMRDLNYDIDSAYRCVKGGPC